MHSFSPSLLFRGQPTSSSYPENQTVPSQAPGALSDNPEIARSLKNSGYQSVKDVFMCAKDHYINGGSDHLVFAIPNNDDYVLDLQIFSNASFKDADQYPGLNLGQRVAISGDFGLHPKIHGFPNGVIRREMIINGQKALMTPYDLQAYQRSLQTLQTIAAFPQKAYTDFAGYLQALKMKNPPIYFDPGANNIMVDPLKQRFTMIDPSTEDDVKKEYCIGNHLSGMTAALLDSSWVLEQKQHPQSNTPIAEQDPVSQSLRRQILKKCLIAAYQTGLSAEKNPFPPQASQHKSHDLGYAFKLAGLSDLDCQRMLDSFNNKQFNQTLDSIFKLKTN